MLDLPLFQLPSRARACFLPETQEQEKYIIYAPINVKPAGGGEGRGGRQGIGGQGVGHLNYLAVGIFEFLFVPMTP